MNPTTILAALLVLAFSAAGAAKLAAVPGMRAKAEHAGFSVSAYRRIGVLEVLGVLGVLAGAVVPALGVLAAVGLLALLSGAIVTHVRSRDGLAQMAPAIVLAAVTAGYLVLLLGGPR